MAEQYSLGYAKPALRFVSRRTLESHGAFFVPHLAPGMQLLDVGCGPGTITLDITARVVPGAAIGVDISESQVAIARAAARERGATNARFQVGSAYELPFEDGALPHAPQTKTLIASSSRSNTAHPPWARFPTTSPAPAGRYNPWH